MLASFFNEDTCRVIDKILISLKPGKDKWVWHPQALLALNPHTERLLKLVALRIFPSLLPLFRLRVCCGKLFGTLKSP